MNNYANLLSWVLVMALGVAFFHEYKQRAVDQSLNSRAHVDIQNLQTMLEEQKAKNKVLAEAAADLSKNVAEAADKLSKLQVEKDTAEANLAEEKKRIVAPTLQTSKPVGGYDSVKAKSSNFNEDTQFLAILDGDKGSGSGFLAKLKDQVFLITNAHVLSDNPNIKMRLMDGRPFSSDSMRLATGYDLVSLPASAGTAGLEVAEDVASSVSVGDEVVVLGNSMGVGVSTVVKGKVTGIGPGLVEVDAPFVPGNSGSPVIHVKTGKVIGVATYSLIVDDVVEGNTDLTARKIERRFAYRLDSAQEWLKIDYQTFCTQSAAYGQALVRTADLISLARDLRVQHINFNKYYQSNSALKEILQDYEAKTLKTGLSPQAYLAAEKDFLFFVIDCCTKDIDDLETMNLDDYHASQLINVKARRDKLAKFFQSFSDGLTADKSISPGNVSRAQNF